MRIEHRNTRRDFLSARNTKPEHHIASVLVQAWPARLPDIERHLDSMTGVECHGVPSAGKLVVTIESKDDSGMMGAIDAITATEGVITVSLVYHHMEDLGDER